MDMSTAEASSLAFWLGNYQLHSGVTIEQVSEFKLDHKSGPYMNKEVAIIISPANAGMQYHV